MQPELQNFISQMRAAGKTDAEISQQLRATGWQEADIQAGFAPGDLPPRPSAGLLQSKDAKFLLWLYGLMIVLIPGLFIVDPIKSGLGEAILDISLIYIFGIVPVATLLLVGYKTFYWIYARVSPGISGSKQINNPDYKWIVTLAMSVVGILMMVFGFLAARASIDMGGLVFFIIFLFGGGLFIVSIIVAVGLMIINKVLKNKHKT